MSVPTYGGVPPIAVTATVVVPPLHKISPDDELGTSNVGSSMARISEKTHPLSSVIITL